MGSLIVAGREKKRKEVVVGGKRDVPLDFERNIFSISSTQILSILSSLLC